VDIFNTSSDESIAEFAELGLFAQFQTTSDEDALFWQRFEFLNNPNNHHLLLGKWLQLINEEIPIEDLIHASTELSELSNDRIGDCVLASLLHFSKQHGKSMEMICWLVSNEGTHFLKNFDKWNDIPGYLFDSSLRIYTAMKKESSTEEFLDNFIKSSLIPTIPLPELK
jgi:hypothetical protein